MDNIPIAKQDSQGDNISSNDMDNSVAVEEELELLRSIYVHELDVKQDESGRPREISIDLHPATADKTEEQFVRLTLVLKLPLMYPRATPEIAVRNSRGLGDEDLIKLNEDLYSKAEDNKGSEVLYQIIELAKEFLTARNKPTGHCAICLYGFDSKDIFTKTECYHHFHAQCLGRYIDAMLKEHKEKDVDEKVVCPVCREEVSYDLDVLTSAAPPLESELAADFRVTDELRELQIRMADLFQTQRAKGGIIDVEAEKNKYLLEISHNSNEENNAVVEPRDSSPAPIPKEKPIAANTESKQQQQQQLPAIRRKKPVPKQENAVPKHTPNQTEKKESQLVNPPFIEPPNNATNYRDKGGKFRGGRGGRGKDNHWQRNAQGNYQGQSSTDMQTDDQQQTGRYPDRPRGGWRGRGGRYSGISWHQQHRRARNEQKRDAENASDIANNALTKKELKPEGKTVNAVSKAMTPTKSADHADFSDRCIQNQAFWGYGPPPSRFVRDPSTQIPSNGRNGAQAKAASSGFQARPPFPRAKPPPGFLAS